MTTRQTKQTNTNGRVQLNHFLGFLVGSSSKTANALGGREGLRLGGVNGLDGGWGLASAAAAVVAEEPEVCEDPAGAVLAALPAVARTSDWAGDCSRGLLRFCVSEGAPLHLIVYLIATAREALVESSFLNLKPALASSSNENESEALKALSCSAASDCAKL